MENILIVEDNFLIAQDLKQSLEKNNYSVVAIVDNAEEAILIVNKDKIDLIIIDIVINGKISGIDLAEIITLNYHIPFIYLTSNSDKKTIAKALKHQPKAYLIKPFTDIDIFTNVKLALANKAKNETKTASSSIVIKVNGEYLKINFKDVFFINSEGNYLKFKTSKNEYVVRMKFKDLATKTPFYITQVHKSYFINLHKVSLFKASYLSLDGVKVPIGRTFKNKVHEMLKNI
jgi:DNA-binding LytR/AlgR family response regulator